MNKPKIQIDNLVREMTQKEFDSYLALQAEVEDIEAKRQSKANARESALAKLAALGLTEEEIGAL
jgi:hypothetical protein